MTTPTNNSSWTDEIKFGTTPKGETYFAAGDRRLAVMYPHVTARVQEIQIKKLFGGMLRIPVADLEVLIKLLQEVRDCVWVEGVDE